MMFGMIKTGNLEGVISNVVVAIEEHTRQRKTEFDWFKSHIILATKQDLKEMENRIMSAISDFGNAVNAKFDELGTAVDGVAADVDFLKAEIKKLQDNPGPISPEDQAILDGIQTRVGGLSDKVKALDAATENPPTPA